MPADIDTILVTVKEGIGIQATDTTFDGPLLLHINSALMILNQLGVGPEEGFVIAGNTPNVVWTNFLSLDELKYLALIKSFVILTVQMLFDPPTSGIVSTARKAMLEEYASRIETQIAIQE